MPPPIQINKVRRTADKTEVSRARSEQRRDVYVCYQYCSPSLSSDDLLASLKADIAADGGVVKELIKQCRWKYSPQLSLQGIASGHVRAMAALQGQLNTLLMLGIRNGRFFHDAQ